MKWEKDTQPTVSHYTNFSWLTQQAKPLKPENVMVNATSLE
jgi:hypothetical protein